MSNQLKKLRIFFDTNVDDYWHERQFADIKEAMYRSKSSKAVLVDSREMADVVLRIGGCTSLQDKVSICFELPKAKCPPEFVWEMGDLPTGSKFGLYVSLPSYMYDSRRHRAFCLPYICNEMIHPFDLDEAEYLYGYCGSTFSGLRARMNPLLIKAHNKGEALIDIREPIWHKMFDRSGIEEKAIYARMLRLSRFNLCPRGAVLGGVGSRLYETIQASRVPVIISDNVTLPEGIDWDNCSVRISERDIARIPQILASYSNRWPQMAVNARRIYEEHFSPESLLDEIATHLQALLPSYTEETFTTKLRIRLKIAIGLLYFNLLQSRVRIVKALSSYKIA
ncbi:exostosin family protein [Pseudanabaena biceps]|nr:exostosin family protein [Pseudanabaena biceps]